MLSSRLFKCVFENSKKSFYKSFNAIFGKIGRFATADVVMHLFQVKCLPVLLYGLNACPVNSTDNKSLEFVIFRALAKIFGTFSKDIINECCIAFNFPLMVENIKKQKTKFLISYCASENHLCKAFALQAEREMRSLQMNWLDECWCVVLSNYVSLLNTVIFVMCVFMFICYIIIYYYLYYYLYYICGCRNDEIKFYIIRKYHWCVLNHRKVLNLNATPNMCVLVQNKR